MSIDVSVVVPVYNSEPYLCECVDSLLSQTLRNVEYIFVDDGSTDRSLEILKDYQAKDARIKILQQKNQYAGVARNNGMKEATGKYIIFLDSDDFFEPTMLEEAFNCAEENRAQIVVFDFFWYDNETKTAKVRQLDNLPQGVFAAEQAGERLFKCVFAAPWNKLFLKSYIEDLAIQFQPVRKSNDTFFTLTATALADRIVYLNSALVQYRINNPTSLQGNQGSGFGAFLDPMISLKNELKGRKCFSGVLRDAYNYYSRDLVRFYEQEAEKTPENVEKFYCAVKPRLTQGLFDSAGDFAGDTLINQLQNSTCVEGFLLSRLHEEQTRAKALNEKIVGIYDSTASKKSMDYRIGHFLLIVPRLILRLFRKK